MSVTKKTLEEINELRKLVGLPPITRKERKCMLCEKKFKSYHVMAWCSRCKAQVMREQQYLGDEAEFNKQEEESEDE